MNDESSNIPAKWLAERIRPGNWLDIDPAEEIPAEVDGWSRTVLSMHQISFSPEIRRRLASGALPDDFLLWGAQLIQPHGGGQVIRLNNEIQGVPYLRTGRPVEKGDEVLLSDFANLEYFDLNDDELDCGHFTIFWTGQGWIGAFDFRAGRSKCLSLIKKAQKFVASTRLSIKDGLAEPAIDSLHTACELLAKVRLILSHVPAGESKSHGSVNRAINLEGKLGNVDPAFLALFNRLWQIRNVAKYATGFVGDAPDTDDVDLVESMARGLHESVQQRRPPTE